MKIIRSTKNSTGGNVAIKAATNKNSSVRLQMKEELMDQILPEIKSKLKEIMTSPKFGFSYTEWRDYSGADIYLNNDGYFVVTVYAEVSYDGLVDIMDALNPIVEKYDPDAYFDTETPGRCSAYIDPDNIPSNMYPYDDIQNSEKIYSSQSQYTNRAVLKYKNKSFTIYDNSDSINLPADADLEALRKWKAQISQQAGAYNDADEDYEWASLSNGVVSYYRRGKLVDKSYYMSPSDWGVETLEEWFQLVINDVIENLYEANRDVPDHMVYNSTDIEGVSAGDNPMSFRYKGHWIKLLTDGTGYAIYEKGEMIDYGFKSLEDAEAAIDEYDDIYQDDVQVYSATNDGEGYWFFTTHGVQPGSVPRDVDILDIIDTPNGSFVKFDRFLSTKELDEYDMIEKAPKSVMSSKESDVRLGDTVEGASNEVELDPEFRNNFEEAIDFFYESYPATVELTDEVDEDYDTLYKAYVRETGSLYQQTPGIVYIDINWDSGEILQALEETAESIGIEHYPDDDIEMSTFSDKNDVTSSTIKTSYEVELDPEESMIDMNIDQYIIVDSEGSWDYDSDNYNWASSDGEGSDWYSDNGVRLDDPTGVVEKIDELIEPHIPIEPGTYRVQGYIELYYTVSGVYENRYDYTEDDYSSDINSDFGSAEYNKKLSKIENVKVTKI